MVLLTYTDPFFMDDLTAIRCKDDMINVVDAAAAEFFAATETPETGENLAKVSDFIQSQILNMEPGEKIEIGMITIIAVSDERYKREYAERVNN